MLISRPPPKKPAYPSLRDAGPPGGAPLNRGGGGKPQLWRYYCEQRLHGRAAHGACSWRSCWRSWSGGVCLFGRMKSARRKGRAAISEQRAGRACECRRLFCGIAKLARVLNSGYGHEGVHGFEYHPSTYLFFRSLFCFRPDYPHYPHTTQIDSNKPDHHAGSKSPTIA